MINLKYILYDQPKLWQISLDNKVLRKQNLNYNALVTFGYRFSHSKSFLVNVVELHMMPVSQWSLGYCPAPQPKNAPQIFLAFSSYVQNI